MPNLTNPDVFVLEMCDLCQHWIRKRRASPEPEKNTHGGSVIHFATIILRRSQPGRKIRNPEPEEREVRENVQKYEYEPSTPSGVSWINEKIDAF